MTLFSMSSRSSVDRAPPRCPGGHEFDSFGNSDFFLCPTLVSCLSIQLSHFISDIFIHLQFFIYLFQENSDSSKEGANHSSSNLTCACEHSTSLPKAASSPCLVDQSTALVNAGSLAKLWQRSQADVPGACGGNAGASPVSLKEMSSGYFSVGFESLPTAHSLSRELRSKLSVILDPPHEYDWRVLAENIGLSYTDIRWIESRNAFSPTEILFNLWETTDSLKLQYPLQKIADILEKMGRDDAVKIIEAKLHARKETTV